MSKLGLLAISVLGVLGFYFILKRSIKLDSYNSKLVSYSQLPLKVKHKYSEVFQNVKLGQGPKVNCLSLDKESTMECVYTGMDSGLLTLMFKGHNHHFYINDKHFKLRANKGRPFVLSENKLYFPSELMISANTYADSKYCVIDILEKTD